jgi:AcrR family transcriptional regulator
VPTGIAIRDAREQLFAAAERILIEDGPSALTSRSVTAQAGVSKGVLHRHFADFDDFLAELVLDRIAAIERQAADLLDSAGTQTVVRNLSRTLTAVFDPVAIAIVALISSRDELRARLRKTAPSGIPLLTQATAMISAYLAAERDLGRITLKTNVPTLALALIGTGHLLFAGELGAQPDPEAVEQVVASIVVGAQPGPSH